MSDREDFLDRTVFAVRGSLEDPTLDHCRVLHLACDELLAGYLLAHPKMDLAEINAVNEPTPEKTARPSSPRAAHETRRPLARSPRPGPGRRAPRRYCSRPWTSGSATKAPIKANSRRAVPPGRKPSALKW